MGHNNPQYLYTSPLSIPQPLHRHFMPHLNSKLSMSQGHIQTKIPFSSPPLPISFTKKPPFQTLGSSPCLVFLLLSSSCTQYPLLYLLSNYPISREGYKTIFLFQRQKKVNIERENTGAGRDLHSVTSLLYFSIRKSLQLLLLAVNS